MRANFTAFGDAMDNISNEFYGKKKQILKTYQPEEAEKLIRELRFKMESETETLRERYRLSVANDLASIQKELDTLVVSPSEDTVRAVSLLREKKSVLQAEINSAFRVYGNNAMAYSALCEIAENHNLSKPENSYELAEAPAILQDHYEKTVYAWERFCSNYAGAGKPIDVSTNEAVGISWSNSIGDGFVSNALTRLLDAAQSAINHLN
jgi:hypothetical protein